METKKINNTTFNVEAVKEMGFENFCESYKHLKNQKEIYENITNIILDIENGDNTGVQDEHKKTSKKFKGKKKNFKHSNGRKEISEDISSE